MTLKRNTIITSPKNTYQIVAVLGQGTFGITYTIKAIQGREKNKIYALKELFINGISKRDESGNVSLSSNITLAKQYKKEFVAKAKNLITINHPNIIKVYEVFETNGTAYYTMEYIEGKNLNLYINNKKLALDESVKIITKIAYAISYMHECEHMFHLDIKPENIIHRSYDGQILLMGFGLEKYITEDDMSKKESSISSETESYTPVEQHDYKKRQGNLNATTDVYALGAILYKLVTGEPPMSSKTLIEQPQLLSQKLYSFKLPEREIQVIEKAMNLSPAHRYQSVMSFIYDINKKEKSRNNKLTLFFLIMISTVIIGSYVAFNSTKKQKEAKYMYYEGIEDYAFELIEPNQGANHYGEIEYYKFFSNGTGIYMFKSWHDSWDCDDPECNLKSRVDTATFRYKVINHYKIVFKKGTSSRYDSISSVTIDPYNQEIIVDEKDILLYVNETNINWNEIKKILKR